MKKLFAVLFVALGLLIPFAVGAQITQALPNLQNAAGTTGLSPDLPSTVSTIVRAALVLVGSIFLVLTIYAGILWMTAQGKEEQMETAQKVIKAAIIGLFITMAAYAITYFVSSRLSTVSSPPAAVGCCVSNTDNTICSAGPQPNCNSDTATWSAGACPPTCKVQ